MQRIGVLGGTFDPIHHGHLAVADEVRVALTLDRVLFVPAAQQPLKAAHHASAADRLTMVQVAIASNSGFAAWDGELRRTGPSYTVDTLTTIRAEYPAAQVWFILGADAINGLARWHAVERLIALTRFALVERPGSVAELGPLTATYPALHERIDRIAGPHLDVSASEVRARVAAGRPIRYLVPDAVATYIAEHQLYKQE